MCYIHASIYTTHVCKYQLLNNETPTVCRTKQCWGDSSSWTSTAIDAAICGAWATRLAITALREYKDAHTVATARLKPRTSAAPLQGTES
jgi:hypothetical protein